MRVARSALLLGMFASLGAAGYGLVWGFELLTEAGNYRDRTGEGFVFIGLLVPMGVVIGGVLVALLFAVALGLTSGPTAPSRRAAEPPSVGDPVDEAELDRKWARYLESGSA